MSTILKSLELVLFPSRTVQPWEAGLLRRDGEPTVVLASGRHVVRRRAELQTVDLRERIDLVPTQEVLTADGVSAKVSAAFVWAVADPVAYTEKVRDPVHAVYLAVQMALRDALSAQEAEALVRSPRTALAPGATEAVAGVAAEVGIRLLDVVVKDVVLPGDLRAAYAELVVGRQRAQAQLEAARAETAALRSLPTARSCSTTTRRSRSCGSCRRCRPARVSSWCSPAGRRRTTSEPEIVESVSQGVARGLHDPG